MHACERLVHRRELELCIYLSRLHVSMSEHSCDRRQRFAAHRHVATEGSTQIMGNQSLQTGIPVIRIAEKLPASVEKLTR